MIPSALGMGGTATSIEVQKKAKCRGAEGVAAGFCWEALYPWDELSLLLAGSRNVGNGSGFQSASFLCTLSIPPGAGLDPVGLTE